jgi:hypothetical protein
MIAESIYGKSYILKFIEDYENIFTDSISINLINVVKQMFQEEPHKIFKLISLKTESTANPFCFFVAFNDLKNKKVKEIRMSGTDSSLWMLRADVFFEELFKDILVIEYDFYRTPSMSIITSFFANLSEFGNPEVVDSTYQMVKFRATRKMIDSFKQYKESIASI